MHTFLCIALLVFAKSLSSVNHFYAHCFGLFQVNSEIGFLSVVTYNCKLIRHPDNPSNMRFCDWPMCKYSSKHYVFNAYESMLNLNIAL